MELLGLSSTRGSLGFLCEHAQGARGPAHQALQ